MTWFFDPLEPESFDFIMIDPAWSFVTYSPKGKEKKSPEVHYGTMSMEDIRNMPVADLAKPDSVVWCWATHPMVDQQIQIVRDWGFRFATTGVWVKRTRNGKLGFGTGYRLRSASEPYIIATKGNPKTARTVRTVIEGQIREHSRKPEEAYREAERMMPGAVRADIFARQSRPGWAKWGDEAGKFDEDAGRIRLYARDGLPIEPLPLFPDMDVQAERK